MLIGEVSAWAWSQCFELKRHQTTYTNPPRSTIYFYDSGRQVQIKCGFGNTLVGRIKSLELETSSDDDTDPSKAKESFVFFEKKASNDAKVEILVNISKIEEVS